MAFFDWDDINVGNTELDSSENFFSRKHYEHERLSEMDLLQQKMSKTGIIDYVQNKKFTADKEFSPIKCTSTADKQKYETQASNITIKTEKVEFDRQQTCHKAEYNLACELIPRDEFKNEINCCAENKKSADDKEPTPIKCIPTADKQNDETEISNDECTRQQTCHKLKSNLAFEWSTKKTLCSKVVASKGAVSKTVPPPSKAFLLREEAIRRRAEEEKKMREFHARPAPKFNHPGIQQRVHAVTLPVTPHVLKRSREFEEKRRKKLEEWQRKNQHPRFEPRPATVLKEKPFVPQKKPLIVQQCLFNLQTEKRLKERKHYDEIKQKDMEQKRKQEEEERKRIEKEHIRELRKATTFKARPNPFKN